MSATWIAQAPALAAYVDHIASADTIALDTEFMRRDTFYPKLALIQIAADGDCALVDPLGFDTAPGMRQLIAGRVCIMHSASEDVDALAPLLEGVPLQLFDTQIAAAMCGLGFGLSYQRLVSLLLQVEIPKDETRSDWLRRPLSASQLDYAEQDVAHLHEVHALLHEQLRQRDRLEWHAQDCARLARRAHRDQGDPQPQCGFRNAAAWSRARQALLRRVLIWREHAARTLDKPRPWLLDDAAALSLAQQPPESSNELFERTRGLRALRAAPRAELFELLCAPIPDAELDELAPIPPAPSGDAKAAVTAMKLAADALALELDIPAGMLCPRRALEEYAVTHVWPEALQGWRRELLEPALASKLPL
ncbi:MAG TPA: ribonuclease D [Rhodanobacteraceae bacterium]|nr:ribonuclease D [Rhodanobacteraceae bacterium]